MRGKPRRYRHRAGVVYKVTCSKTGMIYIGKTLLTYPTSRWRGHIQQAKNGCQDKFHVAIREVGVEFFEFEPIASALSGDKLLELERILIGQYNADVLGYNTIGQSYSPSHYFKRKSA